MYRYLRDHLRSAADARDLSQEVFITAFKEETRMRYSGVSSLQGFLIGIARNLLMHHFRAGRVRDAASDKLAQDVASGEDGALCVDHDLEHQEVSKILDGFLAELPERDRDFFRQHMVERPPRRVTAQQFRMSEDQVRYLEVKLREKALKYLKRIGCLEGAGAELQRAAAQT